MRRHVRKKHNLKPELVWTCAVHSLSSWMWLSLLRLWVSSVHLIKLDHRDGEKVVGAEAGERQEGVASKALNDRSRQFGLIILKMGYRAIKVRKKVAYLVIDIL